MTSTVLRAADREAVPWKNGGGVTREIAAWPPGSGFDDFTWRVSMAEVRENGPFSRFRGVDRILMVLEGAMRLTIQGGAVFQLSLDTPPCAFDGQAPVASELTTGPVLDLNVMTRRGTAFAHVDRLISPAVMPATLGVRMVFALADGVRVHGFGEVHCLNRYDGLLTESGISVEASTEAQAFIIEITISGRTGG